MKTKKKHKLIKNIHKGEVTNALDALCEKLNKDPKAFKEGEHDDKCFVFIEK